jgi:uncharacterized membrane protein
MTDTTQDSVKPTEDKTIPIISYMTIIGWVIALVMFNDKKTKLGAFHIRQALGVNALSIAIWPVVMALVFIPILGWIINLLLYLGVLLFWILGLIGAINGEMKPLPVLGELFQNWFASIAKE